MYTLHASPDFASFVVHIVLEELGVPYKLHLLDFDAGDLQLPAHLAVNPFGKIPALQTPDGPMFETAAILLWLSDRHNLGPMPHDPARGTFLIFIRRFRRFRRFFRSKESSISSSALIGEICG